MQNIKNAEYIFVMMPPLINHINNPTTQLLHQHLHVATILTVPLHSPPHQHHNRLPPKLQLPTTTTTTHHNNHSPPQPPTTTTTHHQYNSPSYQHNDHLPSLITPAIYATTEASPAMTTGRYKNSNNKLVSLFM